MLKFLLGKNELNFLGLRHPGGIKSYYYRVRPASIRHHLSRQESSLPIKLLTHAFFFEKRLRPTEFESVHIVWKTNGLPLTYSRMD